MVALCIAQQEVFESKPIFVIVDAFSGARDVANNLLAEFTGLQIPKYFSSRESALSFLKKQKINNLFIDSDVGFKNFLKLASLKFKNREIAIHVYEEGLGTYRTDLYSSFKKKLFDFIGAGSFFGGCRFVTGVYVFDTKEYINKIPSNGFKARKIQANLSKFLTDNRINFNRLFEFCGAKPKSSNASFCSLYLSGWKIDSKFITEFKKLEGDLFIKPHPHLRNRNLIECTQHFDAKIPAELIIIDLIEKYKFVHVYDHNSSVRRYIKSDGLTFTPASL